MSGSTEIHSRKQIDGLAFSLDQTLLNLAPKAACTLRKRLIEYDVYEADKWQPIKITNQDLLDLKGEFL